MTGKNTKENRQICYQFFQISIFSVLVIYFYGHGWNKHLGLPSFPGWQVKYKGKLPDLYTVRQISAFSVSVIYFSGQGWNKHVGNMTSKINRKNTKLASSFLLFLWLPPTLMAGTKINILCIEVALKCFR